MEKFFVGFVGLILIAVGIFFYSRNARDYNFNLGQLFQSKGSIIVSSLDFVENGEIPKKFTCDGLDVSPRFVVNNLPAETKSVVLIMEDANIIPEPFTHWISFNLSPDVSTIDSVKVLGNADTGVNDFGKAEYDGPCPPAGATHKYYYRIYALDTVLNVRYPRRTVIDQVIRGHVLATGYIRGLYSKSP